jgi:hypothetical protein
MVRIRGPDPDSVSRARSIMDYVVDRVPVAANEVRRARRFGGHLVWWVGSGLGRVGPGVEWCRLYDPPPPSRPLLLLSCLPLNASLQIPLLIGAGGATIRKIQEDSRVINLELDQVCALTHAHTPHTTAHTHTLVAGWVRALISLCAQACTHVRTRVS